MQQYKQLYDTTNSKLSSIMADHIDMTDQKKIFESRALIAEEMLKEREEKLKNVSDELNRTSLELEELKLEHDKVVFL